MEIQLLIRQYPRMIGLARYTECLQSGLNEAGIPYEAVEPAFPFTVQFAHELLRPLDFDVQTFFTNYPISAAFRGEAVKHLTTQLMGSMLFFHPKLRRTVITVHDIVPYLLRDEPGHNTYRHMIERRFDALAMESLSRADQVIAISTYTKRILIDELKIPEGKIKVVPYGLDQKLFRPVSIDESFRKRFGLENGYQYILYVGSENPRKNLARLIRSFAIVRARFPKSRLIKVGTPEYLPQFKELQVLIEELGLSNDVLFIPHPTQEDLVHLYCLADIFAFPSLYEGFGMPPLEAMACGTPVVCSNAASLPEVVGDAALQVDPYDVNSLAEAMNQLLSDVSLREKLRARGLARAAQFNWERTARETLSVYEQVLNGKDW